MLTRRRLSLGTLFLGALLANAPAFSQSDAYPTKPITIIVPFPAGSATDIAARKIADGLRTKFGQPAVVENKSGADGIVAARLVQTAPADGYTLFVTTNTTHSANPNIYKQLPYDPQKDFTPIGGVFTISYLMAVRANFPADDLAGFIKVAKAANPSLSYGSGNTGSRAAAELLKTRLGFDMLHVPYRGSPQAMADLVSGAIDVFFPDPASALGLLGEKKFKVLGTTGPKRIRSLPEIPTLMELGVPDYSIVAWVGMFAPANLPAAITAKLNGALNEMMNEPDMQKFFTTLGTNPFPTTPAELAAFVVEDTKRWKELVEVAGIERK